MNKTIITAIGLVLLAIGGVAVGYYVVHIPTQLEAAVLFGVVLFYPVMRYPLVGVYVLFIICPLIPFFRRLYYLLYKRPQTDPLIILGDVVLVVMMLGLFFVFRERKETDKTVRYAQTVVLIYLVYLFARIFFYNDCPIGEGLFKFKFYGPMVLAFFVGIVYADKTKNLKHFWNITIIVGILVSLYGLKQLYFGYSKAENLWFSSVTFSSLFINGLARPFSTFQSPAAFADYCQIAVIAVLIAVTGSKVRLKNALFLLVPLFAYCLLITSVRSSWGGLFASFFIWAIVWFVKGRNQRIGILAGAAVLFIFSQFVIETLGGSLNPGSMAQALTGRLGDSEYLNVLIGSRSTALADPLAEYSMVSRMALWRFIFQTSFDPMNAILGRGLGVISADSLYIGYLANFGYPGFVFIVGLYVFCIYQGFVVIDTAKDRDIALIACGITVMNITFAMINLTGYHIHSFPGDFYFWFWNGVLIKLRAIAVPKSTGTMVHESPSDARLPA